MDPTRNPVQKGLALVTGTGPGAQNVRTMEVSMRRTPLVMAALVMAATLAFVSCDQGADDEEFVMGCNSTGVVSCSDCGVGDFWHAPDCWQNPTYGNLVCRKACSGDSQCYECNSNQFTVGQPYCRDGYCSSY